MTSESILDEILTRVRTLETGVATSNVHLEYLTRSDTETRGRVGALERWRWTAGGVIIVASMLAPTLLGHIR